MGETQTLTPDGQEKGPSPLDDLTVFLADHRRTVTRHYKSILRTGIDAGRAIEQAIIAGADPNAVETLTAQYLDGEVALIDPIEQAKEISAACQILAASLSNRRSWDRYWFSRREFWGQVVRQGSWPWGMRRCREWVLELRTQSNVIPFLVDREWDAHGYLYFPAKDPHCKRMLISPNSRTKPSENNRKIA